jgi:hypothetical protein
MSSRRKFVITGIALTTATAGCMGVLENNDEERQELYEEVVDTYGGGETEFNNAMEDFERGEELFRDDSYADAERYFRDAERGFDSAVDSFSDAKSQIRELEELNSVVGDAKEIVDESWNTAISFSSSAQFHRQAAEMAPDTETGAQAQFEAGQQTIEEEGYSRTVTSSLALLSEFTE